MPDSNVVWTVKGGQAGEREERLLKQGLIGGGWEELPSLVGVSSQADLAQRYEAAYPNQSSATRSNYVGQLWSLVNRMHDGDLVVMPLKTNGTVAVGHIVGPYEYRTDLGSDLQHVRPVKWIATDVPRDSFDQDLLYSFGAFLTFGRVRRENAVSRIMAAIKGKSTPGPAPETEDAVETAPDVSALATEQIRQFVSAHFAGHDLAKLIGDILKASSFSHVEVSPPGADLGVDILAGCGPMGLDSPRLAAQIKTGQAGVDEFRALKGVMENFRADQGLLVAWRGFKGTVRNEARSSFFSVRLWDATQVLDALYEVYERLPDDVRSQLPLQRTWTLVPPAEA